MAEKENTLFDGTAQVDIKKCEEHNLPLELSCESCEVFVCSTCVKTQHKDHDWQTIATAARIKRKEILESTKNMQEKIDQLDEVIQCTSKQSEENSNKCKIQVLNLQKHHDAIVKKVNELKEMRETLLNNCLNEKNDELSKVKTKAEDMKEFINSKNDFTMPDNVFLQSHRELNKFKTLEKYDKEKQIFSSEFKIGEINDNQLEAMMGHVSVKTNANNLNFGLLVPFFCAVVAGFCLLLIENGEYILK